LFVAGLEARVGLFHGLITRCRDGGVTEFHNWLCRFVARLASEIVDEADDMLRRFDEFLALVAASGVNVYWAPGRRESYRLYLCYCSAGQMLAKNIKLALNLAFLKFYGSTIVCGTAEPDQWPESPGIEFLPKPIRVWLNRVCGKRDRKLAVNHTLVNTLFQGFKKGLRPITLHATGKSIQSHRVNLTQIYPPDEVKDTPHTVVDEDNDGDRGSRIGEMVRSIMRGCELSSDLRAGTIGRNATYSSAYGSFGNVGHLNRLARKKYGVRTAAENVFGGFVDIRGGGVRSASYPDVRTDDELFALYDEFVRPGHRVVEILDAALVEDVYFVYVYSVSEGRVMSRDEFRQVIRVERVFFVPTHRPRKGEDWLLRYHNGISDGYTSERGGARDMHLVGANFERTGGTVDDEDDGLWSACTPSLILEPLKVRTITKPATCSFLPLQSLQKQMHGHLRRQPAFQLLDEEVSREVVEAFARRSGWTSGKVFVSGDFSQATDKLRGEVSRLILEICLERLSVSDPETYSIAINSMCTLCVRWDLVEPPADSSDLQVLKSLCGGDIRLWGEMRKFMVKRWRREFDLVAGAQTNGQVMGNVLSFPILCLANVCAYWIARELYIGETLDWSEVKDEVLINGDDILFCCEKDFYPVWLETIREFGFEPSAGKNLCSDDIIQINSALFRTVTSTDFYGQGRIDAVVEVGYVNFGLLTGRKKNDCSVDYTSVGGKWVSKDVTQFDRAERLGSLPRIYDELLEQACLPSPNRGVLEAATAVYLAHAGGFLRSIGLGTFMADLELYTRVRLEHYVEGRPSTRRRELEPSDLRAYGKRCVEWEDLDALVKDGCEDDDVISAFRDLRRRYVDAGMKVSVGREEDDVDDVVSSVRDLFSYLGKPMRDEYAQARQIFPQLSSLRVAHVADFSDWSDHIALCVKAKNLRRRFVNPFTEFRSITTTLRV